MNYAGKKTPSRQDERDFIKKMLDLEKRVTLIEEMSKS